MVDNTFTAELRTEFGKGAARSVRRAGKVPAVLYGHGTDPVHVVLPAHEVFMVLKGSSNALFEITVDGKTELALPKDVQRDPIRGTIEHIDLLIVKRGEKVPVEIPVHVIGESFPGTIHTMELQTVRLLAEATNLPDHVTIDISGMHAGTIIHIKDIELPAGTEVAEDPELQVLNVILPQVEASDEEAADEA